MNKTIIKASIKKNKATREYELRVDIDSPHEPGSEKHEAITEQITAELWLACFPDRDFDSEGVKLQVMNHTTGQFEEVNTSTRQQVFNLAVQRELETKSRIDNPVNVSGGRL